MSKFMHQFIHSLEMREKAYFKRFTELYSRNDNKNYLKLYDYLEQKTDYSLEELKIHFADSTISKYLSSEIKYLEEQLLKALVNFHFNNSTENKLQKEILFINILIEKGFVKKAGKILVKTKKMAYEYEEFNVILGLIQHEEEILFHEGILGFTEKLLELQNERILITEMINNLNDLRILREQIRDFQITVGFISDTSLYPEIFKNPLLLSEKNALSLKAREHWFYIKDFSFYLTRQKKESLKISARYLQFVEENIKIFKKSKLLPMISNYLHNCALERDVESFNKVYLKLMSLKEDNKLDQVYIDYIRFSRLQELFYNTNDIDAIKLLLNEVTNYADEQIEKLTSLQVDYFLRLIIRSYFLSNNFEGALKWVNFIYGSRAIESTLDQTRIYGFIIYFELEWFEKLRSDLESARKVLKGKKKLSKLAEIFIHFFNSNLKNPKNIKIQLDELSKKLQQLKLDNKENHAFEHFDYLIWLNSYRVRKKIIN